MISPGRLYWLLKKDLKRGWKASYAEKVLAPKIWETAPAKLTHNSETAVNILTGTDTATMTAWMLASWENATQETWPYCIHDDGSLTGEDKEKLKARFPTLNIFDNKKTTEVIEAKLEKYPHLLQYRKSHALAQKCFDAPLLSPTNKFLLFDSDLLFFKRPKFILKWIETKSDECWFNQDSQEPSPVRPEEANFVFNSPLWPRVNSGLCLLNKKVCDLEFFEYALEKSKALREGNQWRVEQTLLALGASKLQKGGMLSAEQYQVTLEKDKQPNAIARHYIGAVRDHFYREGITTLAKQFLTNE